MDIDVIEFVVEASGVDPGTTESDTLSSDGKMLEGVISRVADVDGVSFAIEVGLIVGVLDTVVLAADVDGVSFAIEVGLIVGVLDTVVLTADVDGVSSAIEVGLIVGVLDTVVLIAGVLIAGMLTIGVVMIAGVDTRAEVAATESDGVSSVDRGRVLFAALVGDTIGSVVLLLSVDEVVELMCLCLTVSLAGPVDVVLDSLSVVDVVGIGNDIGGIERVVKVEDGVVGTTTVVGVVSSSVDDGVVLKRVSLSGKGEGGVWSGVLVALCVPFVTIIRLICFKRYLGLSAPPCPAGAAAAAGLRVASTARDAAKTIDDLRTMAAILYFNIIYIIRYGRYGDLIWQQTPALVRLELPIDRQDHLLSGSEINE